MSELNLFEEKVIEVGENTKYYVIKQTIYNNQMYLFANELIDEENPSDTLAILRVDTNDESVLITLEKDEKVLDELLKKFSEMI